jgi:hypothetical protein
MHFCFVFCYCTSALLNIVFSKTMVGLNSCDMMNSIPESSLRHNTISAEGTYDCSKGFST